MLLYLFFCFSYSIYKVNHVEFMDNLEAAMITIVEKMTTCEFYAQIYDEALRVRLATSTTTQAFGDGIDAALKDLYAAARAFLGKVKEYFDPKNSGIVLRQIPPHYYVSNGLCVQLRGRL